MQRQKKFLLNLWKLKARFYSRTSAYFLFTCRYCLDKKTIILYLLCGRRQQKHKNHLRKRHLHRLKRKLSWSLLKALRERRFVSFQFCSGSVLALILTFYLPFQLESAVIKEMEAFTLQWEVELDVLETRSAVLLVSIAFIFRCAVLI